MRVKSIIVMAIIICFGFMNFALADENSSSMTLKDRDEIVPEVIKNVSHSVVGIIGTLKEIDSSFYNNKYEKNIIHGTGVIIKSDGEILTNAHVVKDMDKIVVVLVDGSGYEGKLKCIDEVSDLAIVKIEKNELKEAKFGKKEDIIIGKTVIAIGTPISFSLRNSASIGIISGENRSINSFYKLIQTDAAINPGNSGGPLVNLKGEVIGINSSEFMGSGIEGMGFTIPINTVKYVIGQFNKYGEVKRACLSVTFEEDWAARIGLPTNNGLKIIDSNNSSNVLKEEDRLLSVNDFNVNSIVELNEEMMKYNPGNNVQLKINRNGVVQNITATLKEK